MTVDWNQIHSRVEAEGIELDRQVEALAEGRDATPLEQIIRRHVATLEELHWLAENRLPIDHLDVITPEQRERVRAVWERWNAVLGTRLFFTEYL